MWWFLKKIIDDNEIVKYAYGFETKETSGIVCYDKKKDIVFIEKLANGDNETIAKRFLYNHVHNIIFEENAPSERQITIS